MFSDTSNDTPLQSHRNDGSFGVATRARASQYATLANSDSLGAKVRPNRRAARKALVETLSDSDIGSSDDDEDDEDDDDMHSHAASHVVHEGGVFESSSSSDSSDDSSSVS